MAERQERERDVLLRNVEHLGRGPQVRDEVCVREHHALGLAGRSGGVDDGGQASGGHGPCRVAELAAGAPLTGHPRVAALLNLVQRQDGSQKPAGLPLPDPSR